MQRDARLGIGSYRPGTRARSSDSEMMSILPCMKLFSEIFIWAL